MVSVGVVVPVLNEESCISETLEKIVGNEIDGVDLRVIVVDGGSVDSTLEKVMGLGLESVEILFNEKKIQSAGVNQGFRKLREHCDFLLRVDAHCVYPEDYVERCLGTINRTGADSVVVVMDTVWQTPFQRVVAFLSDRLYGGGGSPHRGGRESGWVAHGHHALFKSSAFFSVGGYDENMVANEDAELDARLLSGGFKIFLDSDIRIGYLPRQDVLSLYRQYHRNGCGRAQTALRHKIIGLRQLLPVFLTGSVLVMFGAILCKPITATFLLPYFGFLFVAFFHFLVCEGARSSLKVFPALIAMHFGFGVGFIKELVKAFPRLFRKSDSY